MPKGIDRLTGGVGKAIETVPDLYDDGFKPATQGFGITLALIPRTINAALVPLRKWIANKEYNIAETEKLLAKKLENVGKEEIITPESYVAVPAIQAISYSMDSEILRNLYANLIAKAMYSGTKDQVHPSFVEIIKQMSPIDALIFDKIRKSQARPLITISIRDSDGSLVPKYKNCFWLQGFSLQQCCTSFNNLSRLGLITIPAIGEYTYAAHYDLVTQNDLFIEAEELTKKQLKNGSSIFFEKHFIDLSDFSLLFYDVCVKDEIK